MLFNNELFYFSEFCFFLSQSMEKTVIKGVHEASINAIKDIHKITNDTIRLLKTDPMYCK